MPTKTKKSSLKYNKTTALEKILKMKSRLRIIQGGSSAGKTIAILLILIDYAQTVEGKLISVVSESVPHLKRGAQRDFLDIMKAHGYYHERDYNRTDSIYNFETGTRIELFGADDSSKVRGPRRDILFVNEANNISYDTFRQLALRTNDHIYIDYNPVSRFYAHEELMQRDDHDYVQLTYKDNEMLSESVVQELEAHRHNENFWKVYGLGEVGRLEGLIFKHFESIDEVPEEARLIRKGLDFGYTNDPSVLLDIYEWNGGFIIDEVVYAKGLSNKELADYINTEDDVLTVADSAEPKSIDEIKSYGVWITGSTKGKGSVNQGIQLLQDKPLWVTKRSTNVHKDFRNYQWKTDRSGEPLNTPEHTFSHSPDAARYAITDYLGTSLLDADDFAFM